MLSPTELESYFIDQEGVSLVTVAGDGYHYELTIVGEVFEGLSPVARQQWVYARIGSLIQEGTLHAVTMKTWTNEEWEKKGG